jgi:hypothetical protein
MMDLNYGAAASASNPEDPESNPATPDVVDLVSHQSCALPPVTVERIHQFSIPTVLK